MIGSRLLPAEEEMDRFASRACGTIAKHDHIEQHIANETGLFQRGFHARQIVASHQQVDIARVPDRPFVDRRHPGGDGVPADDGVRHARLIQCPRRTQQALAHLGHGSLHAVENVHAHEEAGA